MLSQWLRLLDGVGAHEGLRTTAQDNLNSRRLERPVRVPEPGRGKAQVPSRQEEHQPPVDADLPLSL